MAKLLTTFPFNFIVAYKYTNFQSLKENFITFQVEVEEE